LLWAVSGSSSKFLFQQGITPFQLVQIRVTLASAVLLLFLCCRQRHLLLISSKDILYFAVLGIMGMGMVQFTYFFTISKIKVAAAILLQYMAPILIALYSVVFAREKLIPSAVIAIFGATAGCYLVVGAYDLDLFALNKLGVISGLCAAAAFAFYSVYGERGMRRYSPWTVLFYALLASALFWNMAHLFWNAAPTPLSALLQPYSATQWGWILYIVVLGTVVPFGLYFEGISLIRSTRASITATLEPIMAGLISYLFLGELMGPLQLLGGALVIASVIILQLRQEYDDKAPSIIRARKQTA
jgi:drug/metabolite transporter (DMT)-like permease